MAAPDTTPTCGFHGGFTTSYIPLSFHMFISQEVRLLSKAVRLLSNANQVTACR